MDGVGAEAMKEQVSGFTGDPLSYVCSGFLRLFISFSGSVFIFMCTSSDGIWQTEGRHRFFECAVLLSHTYNYSDFVTPLTLLYSRGLYSISLLKNREK